MKKSQALDNMWITKDNTEVFLVEKGTSNVFNLLSASKVPSYIGKKLIDKNERLNGTFVYFIPKDSKGEITGDPIKLLRINFNTDLESGKEKPREGGSAIRSSAKKSLYIKLDDVAPLYDYILTNKNLFNWNPEWISDAENKVSEFGLASKFTGLDDVRGAMNRYGVNGYQLDLSNASGLDESISNSIGMDCYSNLTNESLLDGLTTNTSFLEVSGNYRGKAKAKTNAPKIVKKELPNNKFMWKREGNFVKGDVMEIVDFRIIKFWCPFRKNYVTRKLVVFSDNSASIPYKWEKYSDDNTKYSNLINESLLDGLTENTSLLNADGYNAYSNLTNQSLLDGLTENTSFLEASGYQELVNPRDAQMYARVGSFYAPSVILTPNKTKVLKSLIRNAPIQGGGTLDLILFMDNTIGRRSEWFTLAQLQYMSADGNFSNLINQNLLDGLTENTSMLEISGGNKYTNLGFAENLIRKAEGGALSSTGLISPNQVKTFSRIISNVPVVGYGRQDVIVFTDKTMSLKSDWTNLNKLQSSSFNKEEQYSNGIGDWFKNLFKKDKDKDKKIDDELADEMLRTNQQILDGNTVDEEFEKSEEAKKGRPIRDWFKSGKAKIALNKALTFAALLLAPKTQDSATQPKGTQGEVLGKEGETPTSGTGTIPKDDKEKEVTIFGLKPITFGIVSVGVLVGGIIAATYFIRKNK